MQKSDDYGWRQQQNNNKKQDKSVLGATLALSSSWAELLAGAKVDQKLASD